jgi:hypothetical protein
MMRGVARGSIENYLVALIPAIMTDRAAAAASGRRSDDHDLGHGHWLGRVLFG